jgi:hypothetical protein
MRKINGGVPLAGVPEGKVLSDDAATMQTKFSVTSRLRPGSRGSPSLDICSGADYASDIQKRNAENFTAADPQRLLPSCPMRWLVGCLSDFCEVVVALSALIVAGVAALLALA